LRARDSARPGLGKRCGFGATAPGKAVLITFPPSLDCELSRHLLAHYRFPYEVRRHVVIFSFVTLRQGSTLYFWVPGGRPPVPRGQPFLAVGYGVANALAPLVLPDVYASLLPSLAEMPPALRSLIAEIQSRPAGQFALRIYRDHRGGPEGPRLARAPGSAGFPGPLPSRGRDRNRWHPRRSCRVAPPVRGARNHRFSNAISLEHMVNEQIRQALYRQKYPYGIIPDAYI
jgi:hypothetical protein